MSYCIESPGYYEKIQNAPINKSLIPISSIMSHSDYKLTTASNTTYYLYLCMVYLFSSRWWMLDRSNLGSNIKLLKDSDSLDQKTTERRVWNTYKNTSNEKILVVRLQSLFWMKFSSRFKLSHKWRVEILHQGKAS